MNLNEQDFIDGFYCHMYHNGLEKKAFVFQAAKNAYQAAKGFVPRMPTVEGTVRGISNIPGWIGGMPGYMGRVLKTNLGGKTMARQRLGGTFSNSGDLARAARDKGLKLNTKNAKSLKAAASGKANPNSQISRDWAGNVYYNPKTTENQFAVHGLYDWGKSLMSPSQWGKGVNAQFNPGFKALGHKKAQGVKGVLGRNFIPLGFTGYDLSQAEDWDDVKQTMKVAIPSLIGGEVAGSLGGKRYGFIPQTLGYLGAESVASRALGKKYPMGLSKQDIKDAAQQYGVTTQELIKHLEQEEKHQKLNQRLGR